QLVDTGGQQRVPDRARPGGRVDAGQPDSGDHPGHGGAVLGVEGVGGAQAGQMGAALGDPPADVTGLGNDVGAGIGVAAGVGGDRPEPGGLEEALGVGGPGGEGGSRPQADEEDGRLDVVDPLVLVGPLPEGFEGFAVAPAGQATG